MEENNDKKSNTLTYVIAIIAITVFWGLPSLISGNGFMNGIVENIKALLWIIGVVIAVVLIFKITDK